MNGNIGAEIKTLRKSAGMSLTELARELSISKSMVAAYENGTRHPSFKMLYKLNEVLGLQMFNNEAPSSNGKIVINQIRKFLKESIAEMEGYIEDEDNNFSDLDRHDCAIAQEAYMFVLNYVNRL